MTLKNIIKAQERIAGLIKKTELRKSSYFGRLIQGSIFLKLENLQITNAFKIRGALNKLCQLKRDKLDIITASSGNHGQAVARASRELGFQATIIIPEGTPEKKRKLIQKYGAKYIIYGKSVDQAEAYGRKMAEKEGKIYISPYNDPEIIAGAGTIGLELSEQYSDLQSVLVPMGGGGLISGVAMAVKERYPGIQIIGVQPKNDAAMYYSIQEAKILSPETYANSSTIADGLAGGIENNSITFHLVQKYVDQILLVQEQSIQKAIYLLWEKEGLTVEGAGAVGVAAILENPDMFLKQKLAIIISGGNINQDCFNEIIKRNLTTGFYV